jgi:hypothetical protein
MENDQLYKNGEIDWNFIIAAYKENENHTDVGEKMYECKKCNEKFMCKNYNGKYPLCVKHRLRE